jgi:hypothetical protein
LCKRVRKPLEAKGLNDWNALEERGKPETTGMPSFDGQAVGIIELESSEHVE